MQHPTARNVRFTVVDPHRPYTVPYQCSEPAYGGCGSLHLFKTYHLNLDATGAVLIEARLFERLRARLALDGFAVAGEVKAPPPVSIGWAPQPALVAPIVRSPNSIEPT